MAGQRSRHRMRCRECRRNGRNWLFTIAVKAAREMKSGRRQVRCRRCRSHDVVSIEDAYLRAQRKRQDQRCDILGCRVPHPHRKGTHQLCSAYPRQAFNALAGSHPHPLMPYLVEHLEAMEQRLIEDYPNRFSTV